MCEEHDTTSGDSITLQYVYGIYIDEPITLDNRSGSVTVADLNDGLNAERHFYHQNTQFSVHGLTTEGGTLDVGYMYDPYGNHYLFTDGNSNGSVDFDGTDTVTNAGTSSTGNIYTFTGRRFDGETGLHYFRLRMYSSGRGRFINRDYLGYVNGMSLYAAYFVPMGVDPKGLEEKMINIEDKAIDYYKKTYEYAAALNLKNQIEGKSKELDQLRTKEAQEGLDADEREYQKKLSKEVEELGKHMAKKRKEAAALKEAWMAQFILKFSDVTAEVKSGCTLAQGWSFVTCSLVCTITKLAPTVFKEILEQSRSAKNILKAAKTGTLKEFQSQAQGHAYKSIYRTVSHLEAFVGYINCVYDCKFKHLGKKKGTKKK